MKRLSLLLCLLLLALPTASRPAPSDAAPPVPVYWSDEAAIALTK